jgi:hypothetical protein
MDYWEHIGVYDTEKQQGLLPNLTVLSIEKKSRTEALEIVRQKGFDLALKLHKRNVANSGAIDLVKIDCTGNGPTWGSEECSDYTITIYLNYSYKDEEERFRGFAIGDKVSIFFDDCFPSMIYNHETHRLSCCDDRELTISRLTGAVSMGEKSPFTTKDYASTVVNYTKHKTNAFSIGRGMRLDFISHSAYIPVFEERSDYPRHTGSFEEMPDFRSNLLRPWIEWALFFVRFGAVWAFLPVIANVLYFYSEDSSAAKFEEAFVTSTFNGVVFWGGYFCLVALLDTLIFCRAATARYLKWEWRRLKFKVPVWKKELTLLLEEWQRYKAENKAAKAQARR